MLSRRMRPFSADAGCAATADAKKARKEKKKTIFKIALTGIFITTPFVRPLRRDRVRNAAADFR